MSLQVRLICRPETAPGFRLASLAPLVVTPDAGGVASVRAALQEPDTGIVLVDDVLFDRLPLEVRRRVGRRPLPIVVPVPGPAWRTSAEAAQDYILELLRQVIGYRVRLR